MHLDDKFQKHLRQTPDTNLSAYIAPSAVIVGDVQLGSDTSVWHQAVLRADINSIRIGEGTNIQDGAILHLADDFGVTVGNDVTVGHGAILHACDIGDECLIGMRATVMDGAKIGSQSVVGAGALVLQNFEAPPGSLILGSPARVIRPLDEEERGRLKHWAEKYVQVARATAQMST